MWIRRLVVLALCAGLIAICAFGADNTPDALQYAIAAPTAVALTPEGGAAEQPSEAAKSELKALLKSLETLSEEWPGIISACAVTGTHTRYPMKGVLSQTAALTGVYGAYQAMKGHLLLSGRYFYPEELRDGARVLVLDEQLAIALFRVGDPIGRAVTIGDKEYTVVGVIKHKRTPGEQTAYGAYAPLIALEDDGVQTHVLTVWGKAVPGAGAATRFQGDMETWRAGGNFYSLSKERMRALMPLRLLVCVLGALLVLEGFRLALRLARRFVEDCRARLEHVFAVRLTGRIIAYCGVCGLCFAVLLAAFYVVAQYALEPVYVFPEWIPAVPVEPADIIATFWQNRAAGGGLAEYRTADMLSLRFYGNALTLLCAFTGGVALHTHGMWRGTQRKAKRAASGEQMV